MTSFKENEIRQLIEVEYERYFRSFRARDIDGTMAVLDEEFVWKSGDDALDRQQTKDAIAEQLESIVSVRDMNIAIDQIQLDGDHVTVVGVETMVATVKNENRETSESTTHETYRDTWKKTDSGWKLKVSELLESE